MLRRFALSAAALLLVGCEAPPPPNVIVILVDTLRSDHLGCYGYPRPTSPHLDRLAASGYVFDAAIAQSSWTSPSVASLFTSVYPSAHGVTNFGAKLTADFETLAQALQKRGYRTAAVSANMAFINEEKGFGLGFDRFELAVRRAGPGDANERIFGKVAENAGAVTARALRLLEETGDGPFFLYLHYLDPHSPYDAPAPFRNRFLEDAGGDKAGAELFGKGGLVTATAADVPRLVDLYDGEIAYTDSQVGELLDHLEAGGLLDRSIVVVTSDHGEELHDHGGFLHGTTLYRELVQVPLLVRLPRGSGGGRRIDATVQLVDIGPTILEATGEPDRRPGEGRSFLALLEGGGPWQLLRGFALSVAARLGLRDEVAAAGEAAGGYSELSRPIRTDPREPKHSRALRTSDWHYLVSEKGKEELFDVREDPGQLRDRSAADKETLEELAGRTDAVTARSRARAKAQDRDETLTEQDRERLKALGYLQ